MVAKTQNLQMNLSADSFEFKPSTEFKPTNTAATASSSMNVNAVTFNPGSSADFVPSQSVSS